MHHIYNFSLAQKRFFAQPKNDTYDIYENILKNVLNFDETILNSNEWRENFNMYAQNYGIEATILSLIIDPVRKGSTFTKEYLLTSWKAMNSLYTILINHEESSAKHNEIEKYIERGNLAFENRKLHIYVSMIFHIIKYCKIDQISLKEKDYIHKFICPIMPFLVKLTN
jgi:hypothetical protein